MFWYGRKIAQLKKELNDALKTNKALEQKLTNTEEVLNSCYHALEEMSKAQATQPSDCKRGSYCRSCEFGKPYYTYNYPYKNNVYYAELMGGDIKGTYYMCGKGQACPCFVQKEKQDE